MRLKVWTAAMLLAATLVWPQAKVVAVHSSDDYFYSVDLRHVTVVLKTSFSFTGTKDLGDVVLLAKDNELYLFVATAFASFLAKSNTIAPISEILTAHYEYEKAFQETKQGMVFDQPLRFFKRPDGLSFSGWSYRPSQPASGPS